MFSIGEMVMYKTNAVCTVEKIETPLFVKDSDKKYYKLRYLFSNGNEVVYVPVDSCVNLRGIMSENEAKECFEILKNKEAPDFPARQPSLIMSHFQQMLSDGGIEGSLMVLKRILIREKQSADDGKKLKQVEEHYLSIVEKAVTEELSVAMGKDVDEIKQMIRNAIFEE